MNKLRIEQAKSLISKAGSSAENKETFRKAQEGVINSKLIGEILNHILQCEEFLYTSLPSHQLSQSEAEKFCEELILARNNIDALLADFGVLEGVNPADEVAKLSNDYIFLTPKAALKKSLTKWGVDPQRIIVAGVPLKVEDMKILNPKIPEHALGAIEKKIAHVINDLERKNSLFSPKKMIVVIEDDDAGKLLSERASDLYQSSTIMDKSLKDWEAMVFLQRLQEL